MLNYLLKYLSNFQVHFITISDTWHMCTTCKMYFPSISALQSHYSGHHIPGNLPTMRIICTQCNEAFDKMNDFYWHVNQNHLDNIATEWSMCDICNFFVPDYDSLLQHKSYFHEKEASWFWYVVQFEKSARTFRKSNKFHMKINPELWDNYRVFHFMGTPSWPKSPRTHAPREGVGIKRLEKFHCIYENNWNVKKFWCTKFFTVNVQRRKS